MSAELEPYPRQRVELTNEQLAYIASTEFVKAAIRGNMPAIMATVAAGRELGIGDMTALRTIDNIDGQVSFGAELCVMVVRRDGHSISGELGEGYAVARGRRRDTGDEITVKWTLAMAERAGLARKQNWQKYPESMLWARAVTQLCRMLFADCFAGATYTPEELESSPVAGGVEGVVPQDRGSAEGSKPEVRMETTGQEVGLTATGEPQPFIDGDWPGEASLAAVPDDGKFPPEGLPEGLTEAQSVKLNVLVGQLRDHGYITNDQLWRSVGRQPEPSDDGEIHWSPLRDSLTKAEASALIDRLQRYEDSVAPGGFYIPREPK